MTIREWTSGNKDIDNLLKNFQIRANNYECMIEWIPFDRLDNIEIIGQGGFSTVYSATWLDGMQKIENIKKSRDGDDADIEEYVRSRESSSIVALKTLFCPKESPHYCLKEFESLIKCGFWGSGLKIYGLTQNTNINEYLMVFQYANNGNLHKFLRNNFQNLTWKTKLKLLLDISLELRNIHYAGYIHADFHSGNILQDESISKSLQSYVSDLGLSKKYNEIDSEGSIYGAMPYVAPEVLSGQKFTRAADIYGFGVIMSEMSTGQRPFDGYEFDMGLAMKICEGLRPEFAPGTPDCYIKLAKQCMNSDPTNRPTAYDVWKKFSEWNKNMNDSDDGDADKIKMQFFEADKIVKILPIVPPIHSDFMYTSSMINIQKISSTIKVNRPIDSIEASTVSKPLDSIEVSAGSKPINSIEVPANY